MIDKLVKFFKSRKPVAVLVIIFSIICEVAFSIIYHVINKADHTPYMELLYYSSQIVSSIFVVSGVVIAVWQYYLSSRSNRTNLEVIQVQRAIDLSEYYKDNILKYAPAIVYIFRETGILDILNNLRLEQLNDFDKFELADLFTEQQVKQLKNIQNSEKFIQAVIEANIIYNLDLEYQLQNGNSNKDNDNSYIVSVEPKTIIVTFMSNIIATVLNNMEYFALHFSHKTADESVVYQSLHQSYFRLIIYLYYYIAKQNDNPLDKYYTNTIKLFIKWRDEKNQQKEIRSENSKSIPRDGTVIENN